MNSLFYFLLFYSGKYTNKYTHTHSVNHRHSWHRYSPVVFLVLSPPFRQKKMRRGIGIGPLAPDDAKSLAAVVAVHPFPCRRRCVYLYVLRLCCIPLSERNKIIHFMTPRPTPTAFASHF
jgi:hypothetical protein